MLKNVPAILTPELLKILMEMGHGDDIVIGDGNFPAAANAKRLVRLDGHGSPEVLDAILQFLPLDTYVDAPVKLIEVVKGDPVVPVIWDEFKHIVKAREGDAKIECIDRFDFYEAARNAYAVVATSEARLYGCVLLKKGVIRPE